MHCSLKQVFTKKLLTVLLLGMHSVIKPVLAKRLYPTCPTLNKAFMQTRQQLGKPMRVVPLAFTALPTDPEAELVFKKLQTRKG